MAAGPSGFFLANLLITGLVPPIVLLALGTACGCAFSGFREEKR